MSSAPEGVNLRSERGYVAFSRLETPDHLNLLIEEELSSSPFPIKRRRRRRKEQRCAVPIIIPALLCRLSRPVRIVSMGGRPC